MAYCLLPNKVKKFKQALKDKDITVAKLLAMDKPGQRVKFLENFAGKNAKDINLLFEKKLVLKNKILGLKNWVSKVGELGRYSPKKKAEIAERLKEYKEAQTERIFNPKENEVFLNDLADTILGTHISKIEAKTIFDLTSRANKLKEKFNLKKEKWSSVEAKAKYGASKVILERYIEGLKTENLTIREMLLERYYEGRATFKENKAKSVADLLKDTLRFINDNSIAFVAAVDNSFIGRQGINTLMTRPTVWLKLAKNSFKDIYKSLKRKNGGNMAKDSLMAEVYSNPNYINGNYNLAKLIPRAEEQFPTTLPERLPFGIGRIFKASEVAFTNSAIRARIELFDIEFDIAKKNGVDVSSKIEIQEMGKLINSVTARGSLGKMGEGGVIKTLLWAPRMLKANWDVLTAHTCGAGLKTAFARKQAKINLAKIVASTSAMVAIINAIAPGSVEANPLSSDFLKVKVGNTRFDLTGGKASLITLIARALTLKSKSTVTGITKKLNEGGYGDKTLFDVGIDFLTNKTTPFARAVIDVVRGKDFKNKKPTFISTTFKIGTPISIQNFVENFYGEDKDNSISAIIGSIMDLIGISANTYSIKEDWEIKDTKELNQFKAEVGQENFTKANEEYNIIIKEKIENLIKSDEYKNKESDEQMKEILRIKKNAKKQIFNKYDK